MGGDGNSSVMRKKQNGYHSQLCELPLHITTANIDCSSADQQFVTCILPMYSRLGKLRAMQGNRIMDNACTSYCIWDRSSAAPQLSSTVHCKFCLFCCLVKCAQAGELDSGQCMHTILHMRSQLSSSAVQCMHKILHMGSQFSTSAVQQFVTYTRYCIWDRSFAAQQFSSALHAQDTAYGIAVQQFSSSAVRYMHTILHMGSQFSSSAVQQFSSALHAQVTAYGSQFHSSAVQCMHKVLQMGSQFSS
jgi:hypothetical protein